MKFLIDMNLSPDRVSVFAENGWDSVHWSAVGDPRATDRVIMDWARANQYVVFTHDLDFGTLLAITGAEGPSVIQVRAQDAMPHDLGKALIGAVRQYQVLIEKGALILVDRARAKARILPLRD